MRRLRFMTGMLAVALFVPVVYSSFSDISDLHPYSEAVLYVQSENIVSGYGDGTFQPERKVTRAEFTKIIVGARFEEQEINNCNVDNLSFYDVPNDAWFAPYICVAAEHEIVAGYPDNTFRPGNTILFSEASKILTRGFDLEEYTSLPTADEAYQLGFRNYTVNLDRQAILDGSEGPLPWYRAFVKALESVGAIPTTVWRVGQTVNRGEVAEMIYRLRENLTDSPNMRFSQVVGLSQGIFEDFASLIGDFAGPQASNYFTADFVSALFAPASYYIHDVPASEQADYYGGQNSHTCKEFSTDDITIIRKMEDYIDVPDVMSVTFHASANGCNEAKPVCRDTTTPGVRECEPGPLAYELTLSKNGSQMNVTGAMGNRLKISRSSALNMLVGVRSGAPETYNYTQVDTFGTLSTRTVNNELLYEYRTPWQAIFNDLRGIGAVLAQGLNETDQEVFTHIYSYPMHNKMNSDSYYDAESYQSCLGIDKALRDFCFDKQGNMLVIGGRHPLADHVTLWIDEYFMR